MVRDDALGVAGGARGVVECDGVPLIGGERPLKVRIALCQKGLVVQLTDQPTPVCQRVVHVHHQGPRAGHQGQCGSDGGRKLPVGDQHPCLTVLEHERDSCRIEAGVQGIEHRAEHWYAKVGLKHGRRVGQHGCHRIASADAAPCQGAGQLPAAPVGLRPGVARRTVHHRQAVRVDLGRAREKAQG